MNLRFIFLFLGGIWSEEYFDSGQSPSHEAHEIVLQVSEFTSHGKHTNNKKRVILEQSLEVTVAPDVEEDAIPQSEFNTFQFYQAPPSFSNDLPEDQPQVVTDAEEFKGSEEVSEESEAENAEASGDNEDEYDEEMVEKSNEPRPSKQPREKQPRPSREPKVKPSREPRPPRSTREPRTSRAPRSTREPRTSRAPKPPKPSKVPRVKPTRPIRIKTTRAPKTRSEWVSTTVVTTTSTTAEYDYFANYEDYGSDDEGFNYEEAYAQAAAEADALEDVSADEYEDEDFFNATSSGFPGDGETRRKKPKPAKTDQIEFRVNPNECRVLPSNCNPAKFNFVDCTNENKFVWQNKDKCKFVSTQDQAWRWRSIMCKCRRNNEDKKVKCGLETAFEYTDGGSKEIV